MYTYKISAALFNRISPTALPGLKLNSRFKHVVNVLFFFLKRLYDRKPYHLSSGTWALLLQPLKVKWIFNVCGPLYTRTSFLWFFNPIIFVSSYFKNNQDNEVISKEALNKASQARLIPFVFNPTIAQAPRQHWYSERVSRHRRCSCRNLNFFSLSLEKIKIAYHEVLLVSIC